MKLNLSMLVSLLALGVPEITTAGNISDADGDLVPDTFDNCVAIANGPNEGGLNQMDGDLDGYGNACDTDYNQSGAVNGADFTLWIAAFNTFNRNIDLTGDGVVNGKDFRPFITSFNTVPGPSGLSCAGIIPCTP